MSKLAVDSGVPPVLAILIGIGACAAFGLLNGSLVTFLNLPAFIVTLGPFNIAFALTHISSEDETMCFTASTALSVDANAVIMNA